MILATLPGAVETKVRPAVVISSTTYLTERPDVIVGILTSRIPSQAASSDYVLVDWQSAGEWEGAPHGDATAIAALVNELRAAL